MIEVQHLTKQYGPFTAVERRQLQGRARRDSGLSRARWHGKTTTMRILTGYMPPTDGKAGSPDTTSWISRSRPSVSGYLPETPPLYPDMTVRAYLEFCARIKGVPERSASRGSTP